MPTASQSLFQTLKPACVALGETALKFRRGDAAGPQLCSALRNLYSILGSITRPDRRALDGRLAEYVFFPVSHVFRERSTAPVEALELACRCLKVLLDSAWQSMLAPELGHQLMILLTFVAGGSLTGGDEQVSVANASEELQSIAFECEALVFTSVGRDRASREAFLETNNIPAIGHAISVLLDSVKDPSSKEVGLAAISALQAFLDRIATKEVAASFLPGIVSAASHVLTPNTKSRRPYQLIVAALSLLRKLIVTVFSDLDVPVRLEVDSGKSRSELIPQLNEAWFKGNASQVKVALASIVKLGRHDRKEVRATLQHTCIDILSKCSLKLSDSIEMLLDASTLLASSPDLERTLDQLQDLVLANQQLQDALSSISYDWFTSMPRIMLSNDEQKKKDIASKLILGQKLLLESGNETAYLNSVIMTNLRDSLSSAMSIQAKSRLQTTSTVDPIHTSITILSQEQEPSTKIFQPTLSGNEQVNDSIGQIGRVVQSIGSSPHALTIAQQALESVRKSEGRERLTSMWLAINLLRSNVNGDDISLELLNLGRSDDTLLIFDEIFAISLSILNDDDEHEYDWRLRALALEAVALNANVRQRDFRAELVDVLYTIVHLMGSSVEPLRDHAMTCINSVALSCGYVDAKDLLVSNADYLVNAIGLKIDSFDLSPQVSQVLSMTISLAGSSIIPYLDDVVESIFGALDCFHEYSLLTEVLFSSLDAVVAQGVKTNPLAIEDAEPQSHSKAGVAPTPVSDAVKFVQKKAQKVQKRQQSAARLETPHRPWKGLEEDDKQEQHAATETHEDQTEETEPKTPTSHTYELIKRITLLTQHHLPSSSPSLRMSLLNLLSRSLPYLSSHEDSFLPLVHTLWPVLVPRLSDPETYVVAGVLTVLSKMCEGAGDFMSSRIEGLWPTVRRLHKQSLGPDASHAGTVDASAILNQNQQRRQITSDSSVTNMDLTRPSEKTKNIISPVRTLDKVDPTSPRPYQSATVRLLHRSLTEFLVALLTFVRMSDARVNEIIDHMLNDAIVDSSNSEAKTALRARNPDAFWLAMESAKLKSRPPSGWSTHKPIDIDGAPIFVQAIF